MTTRNRETRGVWTHLSVGRRSSCAPLAPTRPVTSGPGWDRTANVTLRLATIKLPLNPVTTANVAR